MTKSYSFCRRALPWGQLALGALLAGSSLAAHAVSAPPAKRAARPMLANDAAVTVVYTYGRLATPYALPHSVQAVVTNNGTNALTNLPVTLTVTGSNSFTDTKTVASLASGTSTTVTFAAYPATLTLGTNVLTVSVPNDDDNTNNTPSVAPVQRVTTGHVSYIDTTASYNLNGATVGSAGGQLAVKYTLPGTTNYLSKAIATFAAATQAASYQLLIYDASGPGSTPGNVLYTSGTRTRPVSTAISSASQVLPNVQVGSTFFVAIRELDNPIGLATQAESPLRPATFYFQAVGGNWTPTAATNRRALDVVVGAAPACPSPTNVSVSSVAPTTATVSFTAPANGTQYQVIYVPAGNTPTASSPSVTGTSSPITLTGLTANTRYDVYIVATCGTTGTSLQTGPFNFASACRAYTFPYTESFDGATSPALPCGITVQDVNNDGATWTTNTTTPASSPNSMRYNYSTSNAANDWFYTPGLPLLAGKSYQVQFKYRGYTSNTYVQGLEVNVGTAATANAQTTTLFTNNNITNTAFVTTVAGNVPGQVLLFTPQAAGTYYFGFHATSAAFQYYLYVDDLVITEVTTPVCAAPGAPTISSITASSATVTFSAPTNGTQYTVVYVPTGTTPTATSPSVSGTSPTLNLTGLNQNTSYDVYVTATCGTSGTSTTTGPVSFLTLCQAVTQYPYVERFDAVTAPALPCGITVLDANNDGKTWATDNGSANSAPNAMRYSWNSSSAADDWFFTAPLVMTAGKSYQLKFRYKAGSTSYQEGLEVKVGNAAAPSGQSTTLFFNTSINFTSYATTTASNVALFTPTTSGTYYMGFHCISAANLLYLYVDDIEVTETTAPNCVAPTALAVSSPTTTSATVTFTAPTTGASSYTLIYGLSGFALGSAAAQTQQVSGSPATLNSLTPNSLYDVYVQSNCTAGGTSGITGPVTFATACPPIATVPYTEKFDAVTAPALPCGITVLDANGDGTKWANAAINPASSPNAMRYSWNGTNAANDWFFTTALNLQGGNTYQLKFKYRSYSSTAYPEAMEVKVGRAATVAGQTTLLFTNNNIQTDTYVTTTAGTGAGQVASFTPTIGGTYYFGFHATSVANQYYLYVDDVEVTVTSVAPCPSVASVSVGSITSSTAAVSFTALSNGTQYQVVYVPAGTMPTATSPSVSGTTSPITLTGLTATSGYDVYVRATCGTTGTSTLTGPTTFTTACVPATMPYLENFDKVTAPALPCGVTVLDANNDNSTWASIAERPASAPNAMRYTFNPLNQADDWFFTDALSLTAGTSYQLQFKYRSATYAERMEVKVGNATTAAGQTTLLFSNINFNNTNYATTTAGNGTNQVAAFTPTTSGNYYFGFHAISAANAFYIYVDDVQVNVTTLSTKSNAAGFGAVASPVPFGDHLNVALTTLQAGPVQLTLHDAVGRTVRESTTTVPAGSTSLPVPGAGTLPAGIYLLTVRQGSSTQVIRVAHE